ncbi:MAG: flagellar filament capping protein FliD [Lachnospiraceae bacterium]|nr:flagellar filament capping protein FliD [Lachnospiraceae bacterium]
MRVTDQILNQTARKAGVPVSFALSDYLSSKSKNSLNGLEKNQEANLAKKNHYEKLEKTAEELAKSAQIFLAEGADSIFAKAKESGSNEEIYKHLDQWMENYNSTLKSLKNTASPLNNYYRQMLQDAASENSEALKNAGITIGKDGTLSVDKEKLHKTDRESLESLFGASGTFSKRVSYLGERVADNARANAKSYSNQYNAQGNDYSAFFNKYDFWG